MLCELKHKVNSCTLADTDLHSTCRNLFRGCDYIDIADDLNRWSFGSFLVGVTGGTVQYNEFDAYTIEDVCETMTDPRNGDTGLDAYPIVSMTCDTWTLCTLH